MGAVAGIVWSTRSALRAPRIALRRLVLWVGLIGGVVVLSYLAYSYVTASVFYAAAPALLAALTLVCRRVPMLALFGLAVLGGMFATAQVELGLPVYMTMATLILALGLAAVPGALAARTEGSRRLWFGPVVLILLVLIGLGYVIGSDDRVFTVKIFRQTWWFVMIAPVVCYLPFRDVSRRLMKVILLAALVAAGYALVRWAIGPSAAETAYAQRVGRSYTAFAGDLRLLGGAGDAHGLSSVMVPLVPFCAAIALGERGRWRLLALIAFGACITTLVATDVRSGLLCGALGVVLVLVVAFGAQGLAARRVLAASLGIALAVGVGFAVISTQSAGHSVRAERFRNILQPERDQSIQERLYIWKDAIRDIDRRPLGHGLGSASPEGRARQRYFTASTRDVVSTYLRVAYEQGPWLAVFFALALIAILLALVRGALTHPSNRGAMLSLAAAGAALAYALELGFESIYMEIGSSALAWLVIGLGMRQVTRTGRRAELPAVGAAPAA